MLAILFPLFHLYMLYCPENSSHLLCFSSKHALCNGIWWRSERGCCRLIISPHWTTRKPDWLWPARGHSSQNWMVLAALQLLGTLTRTLRDTASSEAWLLRRMEPGVIKSCDYDLSNHVFILGLGNYMMSLLLMLLPLTAYIFSAWNLKERPLFSWRYGFDGQRCWEGVDCHRRSWFLQLVTERHLKIERQNFYKVSCERLFMCPIFSL